MREMKRLSKTVLFVLIGVAVISSVLSLFDSDNVSWGGLLQNFGTEMAGAVVTYWLLTIVLGTQEKKEELIAQMGSTVNDTAVSATDTLRRKGWLLDGSLKNENFGGANLEGGNLESADLEGATFRRAKLGGATFRKAKLEGAIFMSANLEGINLEGANLEGADLRRAKLVSANLVGANLEGANLRAANLRAANLRATNLRAANLRDVNFELSILGGTFFGGANLECTNFANATYTEKTIWPEGFNFEAAGAVLVEDEGNTVKQNE